MSDWKTIERVRNIRLSEEHHRPHLELDPISSTVPTTNRGDG